MNLILKVENGYIQQFSFWLMRSGVVLLAVLLYVNIYNVNPFFVNTFCVLLLIFLFIIEEEKIFLYEDIMIYKSYRFFNLLSFRKEFKIDEIKDIVLNVEIVKKAWVYSLYIIPSKYYLGEITVILNNGQVKHIRTNLYGEYLQDFKCKLFELKNSNDTFKQSIHRE